MTNNDNDYRKDILVMPSHKQIYFYEKGVHFAHFTLCITILIHAVYRSMLK